MYRMQGIRVAYEDKIAPKIIPFTKRVKTAFQRIKWNDLFNETFKASVFFLCIGLLLAIFSVGVDQPAPYVKVVDWFTIGWHLMIPAGIHVIAAFAIRLFDATVEWLRNIKDALLGK